MSCNPPSYRFCPCCGGELAAQRRGDRERLVCRGCRRVLYINPAVGVAATTPDPAPGGDERRERVVRVLPDPPGINKEFDYLVPESLGGQVRVGTVVRIELHGRRVGGWVVEDDVQPDAGRKRHSAQPLEKRAAIK